jgi:beta-carotene ketolase (CrtO type)
MLERMDAHDAIVIGAGHNGLTCASYLAKAGLSVLVLEQDEQIGGMTRTEELTLPGFRSDVHAYGYQLANLSPAPGELELARHGFELLYPDPNWVHVFPDGRGIEFWRDLDETCRSIAAFSRKDAETYRALVEEFQTSRDAVAGALNAPPDASLTTPDAHRTLRDWCDAAFESEAVKAVFAAWSCHVSLAPDDPGSANAGRDFVMVIQSDGNNVVKGGMQGLSDALAKALRERGGEIRTGARVARIRVEAGRAAGVRLASGEDVPVRGLVACNANPATLVLDLLGELAVGSAIAAKMRRYRWGLATLSIFLALDGGPLRYKASSHAHRCTYVQPSDPTLDYFSKAFAAARRGALPEAPFVLTANEGTVDPSRAPDGRSLMKLVVQPVPFAITADAPGRSGPRSWPEARESYADRVLEALERDHLPSLRDRILKRVVRDPAETLAARLDTIGGCVTHGASIPEQSGAMRPIPELSQYRMPVPNVYLCGAGSHPGGGVSMMPGRNAARRILADLGLAG